MNTVLFECREHVAVITLNRPTVKNALGPEEWKAIADAIESCASNDEVRAVLITGAGGAFSSGGDLKTMPERLAQPLETREANLLTDGRAVAAIRALGKPVVAQIEGVAIGAGLALALACDVRIATPTARLGATFHRVGLTGDFGMLWLLPRVLGPARALDFMLSAEIVDGTRAHELGLVSRLVAPDRLVEETWAYLAALVAGPPLAMARTKHGMQRALEVGFEDLRAWEAHAQAECSRSLDAAEGVAAFSQRRSPNFTGR